VIAKPRNPEDFQLEQSTLEADPRWEIAGRAARSSALSRATQLRDILLFIVRQTILQPDEPIHEFEIAHRVLGRRKDFNPLDDNIVRVQMAHLRKKLDLYFSTEGKDEEAVITVALGSYKPVFSHRTKASSASGVADAEGGSAKYGYEGPHFNHAGHSSSFHAEAASVQAWTRWMATGLVATLLVVLALAIACAALWTKNRDDQHSIEDLHRSLSPWRYQPTVASLWSGFLDSNRDTDIVVGDDSLLLVEQITSQETSFRDYLSRSYIAESRLRSFSPDKRFAMELFASKGLGSMSEFKLARRILDLDPRNQRTHFYSARQYMPELVKQNNVILIGGRISNPWQELFDEKLNFIEGMKFEGIGTSSVINRKPQPGEQASYISTGSVGYCVIAYLPSQNHENEVLLLEGTDAEATEGAGDFITSEEQLSGFLKKLQTATFPPFEVLLKVSKVRGTPLGATVEAYRTYPSSR